MTTFADAFRNASHLTETENGATALNTTGSKLVDLFATIGALRSADKTRIERLFADAYAEDPLLATKIIFYARDIREGLGERDVPRKLLTYAAKHHPEAVLPNLELIGLYGRWDDIYCLIGTHVEDAMWNIVKYQLINDTMAMSDNKPISLLAKWLKTADASSEKTRKLGIYTAKKLGMKVYNYKRILRSLRKYIKVTESLMSTQQWDQIDYNAVPSKAMLNYRNAFTKHDEIRFNDYISKLSNGEAKINASTLYPYDLIEKYLRSGLWSFVMSDQMDPVVEAQWKALPDYVGEEVNAIVMADTSGSMYGRPMYTSIGLALYFAEHNKGAYHNLWMSFSSNPNIHEVCGETLHQRLTSMDMKDWGGSTNLEKAFELILAIAVKNQSKPEEMPKALIIISDMEIDYACRGELFYDGMKYKYKQYGYTIPNIIFWNVNSRNDTYHIDSSRPNTQCFSGQSASTFKSVIANIGKTPYDAMLSVLNSERYELIQVAGS